jgi:hypothetical protein
LNDAVEADEGWGDDLSHRTLLFARAGMALGSAS